MDKGMIFTPTDILNLDCYVDSDFAGLWGVEDDQDPICVRSRTGFVITLANCPLLWVSKLQSVQCLSTTEAEYTALSQSMRSLIPLRELTKEVLEHLDQKFAEAKILSTVFEDNNGCISTAKAQKMTPRTKHIAVSYHFFRSHLKENGGAINLVKISTDLQKADIFTKGLGPNQFRKTRMLLCGWDTVKSVKDKAARVRKGAQV